mmetsp:Transcript_12363/g.29977  ORF Transcript_12363/g.29977 Transcript_12363/m.29977 type:complete len:199 (-) Transcript_12363:125-721(-)
MRLRGLGYRYSGWSKDPRQGRFLRRNKRTLGAFWMPSSQTHLTHLPLAVPSQDEELHRSQLRMARPPAATIKIMPPFRRPTYRTNTCREAALEARTPATFITRTFVLLVDPIQHRVRYSSPSNSSSTTTSTSSTTSCTSRNRIHSIRLESNTTVTPGSMADTLLTTAGRYINTIRSFTIPHQMAVRRTTKGGQFHHSP